MNAQATAAPLDLRSAWAGVQRRRAVVVAAAAASVLGALLMTSLQSPVYQSRAEMRIEQPGTALFGSLGDEDTLEGAVTSAHSFMATDVVQARVREIVGVGPETAIPSAGGGRISGSNVLSVVVRSGDPVAASAFANAYVAAYRDYRLSVVADSLDTRRATLEAFIGTVDTRLAQLQADLDAGPTPDPADDVVRATIESLQSQRFGYEAQLAELNVDARLSSAGVELVRQARYGRQVDPRPRRTMALALAAGLLLGVGAAIGFGQLDRRVRSRSDLERAAPEVPVLAQVPFVHRRHARELRPGTFSPRVLEAYRTLRANLQLRSRGTPLQAVMVTSPSAGDGKTTTAVNLAASMGFSGRQVVVVDGDLRAPRLAESLGIHHPVGLTDVLQGADLRAALVPLSGSGIPERAIWVLPAGRVPPNPSELMAGRRLEAVMEELRDTFSYVVVDTPPILAVSDPGVLMRVVDGVVVVTRADRSETDQIAEALRRVARGPSTLVGVVLNASREQPAHHLSGRVGRERSPSTGGRWAGRVPGRGTGAPAFEPKALRGYRTRSSDPRPVRVVISRDGGSHGTRSDVQRTGSK